MKQDIHNDDPDGRRAKLAIEQLIAVEERDYRLRKEREAELLVEGRGK